MTVTSFTVDPVRLASGDYDHEKDREVGRGDINGAYSGDTIAMSGKVRKPFRWQGSLWATVGQHGSGREGIYQVKAYRLVPLKLFNGTPTTYGEKTSTAEGAEGARNDPDGFYHRMTVKNGTEVYVMVGPPAYFVADAERPEPQTKPA